MPKEESLWELREPPATMAPRQQLREKDRCVSHISAYTDIQGVEIVALLLASKSWAQISLVVNLNSTPSFRNTVLGNKVPV